MSGVAGGLVDFGTRSLVTHAIMAATLVAGFAVGLTVDSRIGVISFVALLNFTAGMWVCQSIHSLGNNARGDDYSGVLNEIRKYAR